MRNGSVKKTNHIEQLKLEREREGEEEEEEEENLINQDDEGSEKMWVWETLCVGSFCD